MKEVKETGDYTAWDQLGIKISPQLQKIEARIIPAPRLELGDHNSIEEGKQSFFNLYAKPIYASKHSITLGFIYFEGFDSNIIMNVF